MESEKCMEMLDTVVNDASKIERFSESLDLVLKDVDYILHHALSPVHLDGSTLEMHM